MSTLELADTCVVDLLENDIIKRVAVTHYDPAKLEMADPLSREPLTVLWVKGSGGDLGTMKLDGFSTLYLNKLLALPALYRGPQDEDTMVGL